MEKILSILGIAFALFVTVAMADLFRYNSENVGVVFAIFMLLIGIGAFVGSVFHFYLNYIKK